MSKYNKKSAIAWYHRNKDTPIMKQRKADRMTTFKSGKYMVSNRDSKKAERQVRYDPLVNWGSSKGRCRTAGASFAMCHQ